MAYTDEILGELKQTLNRVDTQQVEGLVNAIIGAEKIFVAGGGRSGLMGKSFVMRLMHIGFEPYVVGETVTPSLLPGDLFIVGSGSGETQSLAAMTEKAKKIGARVAAVTINPDSTIGKMADNVLEVPAQAKADNASGKSIQPMGSLFEQSLLLLFDSIILRLMEKKDMQSDKMYGRHANLE
ncbi:6-phospho-3-hexuloisomerase [Sediminibacillus dalangtanensis]|nr:6-phospho-3-hexuloisomerase [Sediminibacillus dalangtanensis]